MGFLDSLKQSFLDPVVFWNKLVSVLPNLLAAIVLLVGGYFLGKILASVFTKLLHRIGLDKLSEKAGLDNAVKGTGFAATPSAIVGKIIFWLVFLMFIISACDSLGLDRVSETIDSFVMYLPKVIGAFFVAIIGLFVANLVRGGVLAALSSINLGYERAVGGLVYFIIVIVVISLAIGQLEIKTDLLNQVVVILLLGGALSIGLALGLGTRDVASNVVAGVYARELYNPGSKIRFGDISGTIVEVGSTNVVIEIGPEKSITVPNRRLLEEQVEIISEA